MYERLLMVPIVNELLKHDKICSITYQWNWCINIGCIFYGMLKACTPTCLHVLWQGLFQQALAKPSGEFTGIMLIIHRMSLKLIGRKATQKAIITWINHPPGMTHKHVEQVGFPWTPIAVLNSLIVQLQVWARRTLLR